MSEIKFSVENENVDAKDLARKMVSDVVTKDLIDVVRDLNYYESALKNPTKNASEAFDVLVGTISDTRHVFLRQKDVDKVREVIQELKKTGHIDFSMANKKLDEISSADTKNGLFALIVTKDLSIGVVLEIPEHVKS